MDCFKCIIDRKNGQTKELPKLRSRKELLKHIKYFHLHLECFHCTFCPSRMTNIYTYCTHMSRHYDKSQELNDCQPPLNDTETNNQNIIQQNQNDCLVENSFALENQNAIKYINLDELTDDIKMQSCRYILKLINKSDLTMKRILQISSGTCEFMFPISQFVEECLKNNMFEGDKDIFLRIVKNPFCHISTQYMFIKFLKAQDLYMAPTKYLIRTQTREKTKKGATVLEEVNDTGVLMPIDFMFRKIIELPGIYDKMMIKMNMLMTSNGPIKNFVQGEKWRKIVDENPDKILVPYTLYNDDFSVGNQQGHRSSNQSISVLNVHFPLLDDWELSKLEYLFPICFVKALYTKNGNKTLCLIKLRDKLLELETFGLEANINGEVKTIHFVLGSIIGDNLAVHQMLDATTGFMHEFMCLICLMNKKDREKSTSESNVLFRTIEHYELNKNNPKSGYNRNCPFNKLPFFHVLENFSADIMHDFYEGVAIYGLQASIDDLIKRQKFTSSEFSRFLDSFDYGTIDSRNKLSSDNFKKGKLYLSAYECLLLIKYFPLIIRHRVSINDPVYKYAIILEKLSNLCLSHSFDDKTLDELRKTITEHHKLYMKFKYTDPNTGEEKNYTLKPKHHNMLHYVTIIRKCGPLLAMWAMRHEGLNKTMKSYTNVCSSRVNLSFSLANKFMCIFSGFIEKHSKQLELNTFEFTKEYKFGLTNKSYIDNIDIPFPHENIRCTYKSITFRGTDYKIGYYVLLQGNKCYKIIDIIATHKSCYAVLEEFNCTYKDKSNYYILGESLKSFSVKTFLFFRKPFNICNLNKTTKIFKTNNKILCD